MVYGLGIIHSVFFLFFFFFFFFSHYYFIAFVDVFVYSFYFHKWFSFSFTVLARIHWTVVLCSDNLQLVNYYYFVVFFFSFFVFWGFYLFILFCLLKCLFLMWSPNFKCQVRFITKMSQFKKKKRKSDWKTDEHNFIF